MLIIYGRDKETQGQDGENIQRKSKPSLLILLTYFGTVGLPHIKEKKTRQASCTSSLQSQRTGKNF